jgi:hypothetical protein
MPFEPTETLASSIPFSLEDYTELVDHLGRAEAPRPTIGHPQSRHTPNRIKGDRTIFLTIKGDRTIFFTQKRTPKSPCVPRSWLREEGSIDPETRSHHPSNGGGGFFMSTERSFPCTAITLPPPSNPCPGPTPTSGGKSTATCRSAWGHLGGRCLIV